MRWLRWWAAGAAALVLLAFGAAAQSGAFWRAESRIGGGVIRSGTLDLRVGSATGQVSDYVMTGFGGTDLSPGAVTQKPLTIRNAGDVDMFYRLQNVRQSSAAVPLTLQVWLVGGESACPASAAPAGAALYSGAMIGAQVPAPPSWAPVLTPGATAVWCLRATVGAAATAATSTTVTFDFQASST
ncbi:hypothetical protein [Nocardia jiangsuensis]|uniref:Ribosomally synthesized peptide with SipW-like signal peptide n=1 Tax=Nocardia jiangsuensis TaxID=1691563 RepID=A0ABV8DZ61_9NOCA